jgi:tyrosine-specific transport protein
MENNNIKSGFFRQASVTLLVVGGLVGAGVLALPVNTGLAGFIPAIICMLAFGFAMFFTATVLAKESMLEKKDAFNYPSLYQKYFGIKGKWIAVIANMFLLYGLLIAYITGGSEIISDVFDIPLAYHKWVVLLFSIVLIFIIMKGVQIVIKFNTVFTLIMFSCFIIIVSMGATRIKAENLIHRDWHFLPCTIPIIVAAFNFHNLIPTICKTLNYNSRVVIRAIFLGMCMGSILYIAWLIVGVGALPIINGGTSLIYAFEHNLPATIPLSHMISTPVFLSFAMLFSIVALTASCIANSTGLLAFVEDLMVNSFKMTNKALHGAIAFLPPVIISLIYPDIFLHALNMAAGFGIVMLFGIMPGIIAISKAMPRRRLIPLIVFCLFAGAFLFEVLQETGMLRIKPDVEYDLPKTHSRRLVANYTKKPKITGGIRR